MHRAFGHRRWDAFASSGRAKAVSDLGDAAFANVPLSGNLMITQGNYDIILGVVDFTIDTDRAVAVAEALAARVLPRVAGSAQAPK